MQGQPAAGCSMCGRPLAQSDILYTPDARVVCAVCNGHVDVVHTNLRVGHNMRNAAISSLAIAGVGFVFNPFLVCTITSLIVAIFALINGNRRGEERFLAPGDRTIINVCAIIALVLDGIVLLIVIAAIAMISSSRSDF